MAAQTDHIDHVQLEALLEAQAEKLGKLLEKNEVHIAIGELSAEPVEALGEIMRKALLKGVVKPITHLYGVQLRFSMLAEQIEKLLASNDCKDFTHHAVYAWYLHVYVKKKQKTVVVFW
jgi:hypothetical protein